MFRSIARISLVLAVIAVCMSHTAAAVGFTEMVIFGDSLSDTGNVDRFPANLFVDVGPTGSFSEGIVWNEYLADDLGLSRAEPSFDGSTNYAVGGARTDSTGSADAVLFQSTGIAAQVADFIDDLSRGECRP